MNEFRRFVRWAGGPQKAAELLGVSLPLIYSVMNGHRAVSRRTAQKVVELAGRRFSLAKLLGVQAA